MWKIAESIGLAAAILLGMKEGFQATPPVAAPGIVTDLTATAMTDSQALLVWTEVSSNDTVAAHYDVRYGPAAGYAWWLVHLTPPDTLRGTTKAGGVRLSHVVRGLKPSTAYSFQVTAYTGTLGMNASFSPSLSNVAPGTTAATPPNPPPPPPPPPSVATITLSAVSVQITSPGGTYQAMAIVKDSTGVVLQRAVAWRATSPSVASVDSTGFIQAIGVGTDTVYATSGGKSAFMLVRVPPPPPPQPIVIKCGVGVPPPVGCGMRFGLWALLGIDRVNGPKGPWFMLDTLDHPTQVIRMTVKDTTW